VQFKAPRSRNDLGSLPHQEPDVRNPVIGGTGAQGLEHLIHRHGAVLDHDLLRRDPDSRAREFMAKRREELVVPALDLDKAVVRNRAVATCRMPPG
jgi:hypothetical protein